MDRITAKDVRTLAERLGVQVETWSPGDGVRRFCITWQAPEYMGEVKLLGPREAYAWLRGYQTGRGL